MKPKATQIRKSIVAALGFLKPTYVKQIEATLDDQAAFNAEIPFLRVKRGDSEIGIGNIEEWVHELEIEVTYVNHLSGDIDDQIDLVMDEVSRTLTRSTSILDLIENIQPTEISIDDVESDTPLIAATIKFKITYSEGV